MSELKKQVGHLLKNARKEKGWTQKELGEQLGVTEVTIRRYEMGSQNLTLETLERIVDSLGLKIALTLK